MADVEAEAHISANARAEVSTGLLKMIETFDRPAKSFVADTYAGAGTYENGFGDKPGERLPKIGVYAGAGMFHARAEEGIFDAEVKGPNVCAGIGASVETLSAGAFAKAELASASTTVGPVKAKVGLAVDTGARVGLTGVEARLFGTGFTIGRRMGFSLFGTGIEFDLF